MSTPALPVVALLGSSILGWFPDLLSDDESWGLAVSPHTFGGPEVGGPASRFLIAVGVVGVLLHLPLICTHLPNGFLFYIWDIILAVACCWLHWVLLLLILGILALNDPSACSRSTLREGQSYCTRLAALELWLRPLPALALRYH